MTYWNPQSQVPGAGGPPAPARPDGPAGVPPASDAPKGKHRRFEVVTNWVTAFAAVAAFVLSMLTYLQVNQTPDIHTIMPKVLRMSLPNPQGYAAIYLQPTFTANRRTERPAVLSNMSLLIEPQASGKKMPLFVWRENFQMEQLDDGTYARKMVSDPTPLLVSGAEPVSPMVWFSSATPTPAFEVGKVHATLLVEWQDRASTIHDFCIDLPQEAADEYTGKMQTYRKYDTSECYFWKP